MYSIPMYIKRCLVNRYVIGLTGKKGKIALGMCMYAIVHMAHQAGFLHSNLIRDNALELYIKQLRAEYIHTYLHT